MPEERKYNPKSYHNLEAGQVNKISSIAWTFFFNDSFLMQIT